MDNHAYRVCDPTKRFSFEDPLNIQWESIESPPKSIASALNTQPNSIENALESMQNQLKSRSTSVENPSGKHARGHAYTVWKEWIT